VAVSGVGATEVLVPGSVEDAVAAFGDGSDVTVFAGGTILMPEISHGRLKPRRALFLHRARLDGIREEGGRTVAGAMTPVAQLERAAEPLASAARYVGDFEVRAQATLGGNVCAPPGVEAPRGDLQAALIALGAQVRSAGADGERREPVEEFLERGADGRLVLDVSWEQPRAAAHASVRRPHAHAYTILAVCAARTSDGTRIGIMGAGPRALRAHAVEQALGDGDGAIDGAVEGLPAHDDALASEWYRRKMLPVLVRRALDDLGKEST
jgi:aerobic carbon-monoxide dehydrogenase medium subunit